MILCVCVCVFVYIDNKINDLSFNKIQNTNPPKKKLKIKTCSMIKANEQKHKTTTRSYKLKKKKKKKKEREREIIQRNSTKNEYRSRKITESKQRKGKMKTHTPPATPPAMRDLQMLTKAWLGALTPSLASLASSARFTIVETADSPVVLLTASSEAIKTET